MLVGLVPFVYGRVFRSVYGYWRIVSVNGESIDSDTLLVELADPFAHGMLDGRYVARTYWFDGIFIHFQEDYSLLHGGGDAAVESVIEQLMSGRVLVRFTDGGQVMVWHGDGQTMEMVSTESPWGYGDSVIIDASTAEH